MGGQNHYVYILRCSDGTFYTGWTTDPERRTRVHNSGKGAKYTRTRRPVELIYYEKFGDKIEAQRREWAVKQLTRREKEALIREGSGVRAGEVESPEAQAFAADSPADSPEAQASAADNPEEQEDTI
ncbi:MAG: GIY-YIG nuclease family protein [Mogibacterium sp.]|nr:GIY-YIG nuclease family protein [Mogibacterium sp.]